MTFMFVFGILYYFSVCLNIMVNRDQSTFQSLLGPFNPDELGIVNFNETSIDYYVIAMMFGDYQNTSSETLK